MTWKKSSKHHVSDMMPCIMTFRVKRSKYVLHFDVWSKKITKGIVTH